MIVVRLIFGLIFMALGLLIMRYPVQLTNFTGKIGLAEDFLRFPGAGTFSFWRLFGLLVMILSLLWIVGWLKFLPG